MVLDTTPAAVDTEYMHYDLDYTPKLDKPYDEEKVYAEYIVRPEGRQEKCWAVLRKNTITGQGWNVAKYNDEQLANHVASMLNQYVQSEAK